MRESLRKKIEYSIDLLRKSEKMALRLDPENGFYLAFSGGKDSQALYHIAVMGEAVRKPVGTANRLIEAGFSSLMPVIAV